MSNHKSLFKNLIIFLLATCLTCTSLLYLRPKDCDTDCMMRGEQKVGYPFVMVQDQGSTGGSPLSDWVEFTRYDYIFGARPVGCLLNILFYSILLSVVWKIFKNYRKARREEFRTSNQKILFIQIPVIFLIAIYMTCMSLLYLRPTDCDRDCMSRGEQKVGYPFVMVQDRGVTGSSPTSDWYEFTRDDYLFGARPVGCLLNILFYSIVLYVGYFILKNSVKQDAQDEQAVL